MSYIPCSVLCTGPGCQYCGARPAYVAPGASYPATVTYADLSASRTPRLSDDDVDRIAKRVVKLMRDDETREPGATEPECFTTAGHYFTITPTGNATSALHTGRPLFRVYCSTCGEEVTDSTTDPHQMAEFHIRDRSP